MCGSARGAIFRTERLVPWIGALLKNLRSLEARSASSPRPHPRADRAVSYFETGEPLNRGAHPWIHAVRDQLPAAPRSRLDEPKRRRLPLEAQAPSIGGRLPAARDSSMPLEKRLAGLAPEQRLAGLAPEQVVLALPLELLRALPEEYLRSLPAEIQEEVRKRLQEAAH